MKIALFLQMGTANSILLLLRLYFCNTSCSVTALEIESLLTVLVVCAVLVGVDECNAAVGGFAGSMRSLSPNGILLLVTHCVIISFTLTDFFFFF